MCYHQCVLASYIYPVPQLHVLLQHGSAAERFLPITAQPVGADAQKQNKKTSLTEGERDNGAKRTLTGRCSLATEAAVCPFVLVSDVTSQTGRGCEGILTLVARKLL